jgi:hypothetical protein
LANRWEIKYAKKIFLSASSVAIIGFPAYSLASISTDIYNKLMANGDTVCALPVKKAAHFLDGLSPGYKATDNVIYPFNNENKRKVEADIIMKGKNSGYSTVSRITGVPIGGQKCVVSYTYVSEENNSTCMRLTSSLIKTFGNPLIRGNGDNGSFYLFSKGGRTVVINEEPGNCYIVKSGGSTFYSDGAIYNWH